MRKRVDHYFCPPNLTLSARYPVSPLFKHILLVNYQNTMNSTKAAYQPLPQTSMDFSVSKSQEFAAGACEAASPCEHGACHRQRRRRIFHIAAAGFLLISLLVLLVSQFCDMETMMGLGADVGGSMMGKRDSSSSNSDQGVFVKNKREQSCPRRI